MTTDPARWALSEMLILAARGLGKIDRHGPRGVTMVSMAEIEAMAGALAMFGLVAIPPGEPTPSRLIITPSEET